MTNWLLILVPALVLPIVLLFAFTGCTLIAPLEDHNTNKDPTPAGPPPAPPPPTRPDYSAIIQGTIGLLSWWRFEEGPAFARDYGPLGQQGAYVGVQTWVQTGVRGSKAPEFDGKGGYVAVPFVQALNPDPTKPFSIEAWVWPGVLSPGSTEEQCVLSSHDLAANGYGFKVMVIRAPNATPGFRGEVFPGRLVLPSQSVFTASGGDPGGIWWHVVLTYDAGASKALTLYVNANYNPVTGSKQVTYSPNATVPLWMSADRQKVGTTPTAFFTGRIDEVAFYGTALPQATVKQHYEAGR